ncbi:hypothetical protein ED733_003552 [Metarhizium rileyi]|uniref:Uncharacterized protein n=1 Tax=Metarhizium rileyi (strain RCEF 4871) TaxID=1649241 RepID=A0A5C6G2X9_METRR|nr:hypothetical protein ED733_003552 [Metarhizium rileyi]
MEDPWSSPWATDAPAPPTIDLPSEPQPAHIGISPRKSSRSPSPWGRDMDHGDNDWGGWNDAPVGGKQSPGWGTSPNLKPLANCVGAALDPWALAVAEDKTGERGVDSAIGLADEARVDGQDISKVQTTESSVWMSGGLEPPNQEDGLERRSSSDIQPTVSLGEGRPDAFRQVSKVQELVEMYDDMAKTSSRDASCTEMATTEDHRIVDAKVQGVQGGTHNEPAKDPADVSTSTHHRVEEGGRIPATITCAAGIAKDAGSKTDAKEADVVLQPASESDDSRVQRDAAPAAEDGASPASGTQYDGWDRPTKATTDMKSSAYNSKPSISYSIDFSSLNLLFPNRQQEASVIPERLPDSIIKESFVSVSERKSWYRISRLGSIRRHNGGDDENYVRVGWKGSTVRQDTLAIVRRWMEEDSIGGRAVLGRRLGHGVSGMFNWDSDAPPVEIGELFARKKQKPNRHARQTSATLGETVTSPTLASFGWSSSVPSSPAIARVSSERHATSSRLSEMTERDDGGEEDKGASAEISEHPRGTESSTAQDEAFDCSERLPPSQHDDDEWGDMVSSPTLDLDFAGAFDPISLAKAAQLPSPKHDVDESASCVNEPACASDAPMQHADPWGGLDILDGHQPGPVSWTKDDAVVVLPAPTSYSKPPSLGKSTQSEVVCTSRRPPSPPSSRPRSMALAPDVPRDDETVATLLAALPDLTYMLQ